jgi:tRNA (guanine9-N1)-methyltransferase
MAVRAPVLRAPVFGRSYGELCRTLDHSPFAPRMSKRQRKRLLTANARRAAQREKKRAKKEARQSSAEGIARALAAAKAEAAAQSMSAEDRAAVLAARARRAEDWVALCGRGQRIAIDCEFGHLMTDREQVSMAQQIMYCYARNKRATAAPCGLYLTGVDAGFRRRLGKIAGFENWVAFGCETRSYMRAFEPSELVYLTADSPTTIEALDLTKTYIIGGIVDRNRHKGLTMAKAAKQGIATANLPIKEHLERLNCSDVLTVDQVFALLVEYQACGDWGAAVASAVPTRKRK